MSLRCTSIICFMSVADTGSGNKDLPLLPAALNCDDNENKIVFFSSIYQQKDAYFDSLHNFINEEA